MAFQRSWAMGFPHIFVLALVAAQFVQGQPPACSIDNLQPVVIACLSNPTGTACCSGIDTANNADCFCYSSVLESGRTSGITPATVSTYYKGCGRDVNNLKILGQQGCPGNSTNNGTSGTPPPVAPALAPTNSSSTNGTTADVCDTNALVAACSGPIFSNSTPTATCCSMLSSANLALCFCTDAAAKILVPQKDRVYFIRSSCNSTDTLNIKGLSGCNSSTPAPPMMSGQTGSPPPLLPSITPPPPPPSSAIGCIQQRSVVLVVTVVVASIALNLFGL